MTNKKRLELTTMIEATRLFAALIATAATIGSMPASAQVMDQRTDTSSGPQGNRGAIYIKGHDFPAARFSNYSPGTGTLLRSTKGGGGGGGASAAGGLKGLVVQAQQADVQGNARKASALYWQAARVCARTGPGGLRVSEMNLLSCSAGQAVVGVEKAQRAGNDKEATAIMKEAEPVFRRLERLDWNNPEWPYRLGVILVNVDNRKDEARRHFSQALTIAGGSELYRKKARKKLEQLSHAEQGFGMSGTQLRRW